MLSGPHCHSLSTYKTNYTPIRAHSFDCSACMVTRSSAKTCCVCHVILLIATDENFGIKLCLIKPNEK